jgi:isopentenyl-diphosphate Delta-isomerase
MLVDEQDREIGSAPKIDVHLDGRLHRAVSVLLHDDGDRVLLQRRSSAKYHSGGLWSNTACGHPRPGESVMAAGLRRLQEEMGVSGCTLRPSGSFLYRAVVGYGMVEHEFDHVLVGEWTGEPSPDVSEVSGWKWVSRPALLDDLDWRPEDYTAWLQPVLSHAPSAAP